MNIIYSKRMEFTLYEDKEKYLLSVICGTVAIFEINIYLNQEEINEFEKEGEAFIKSLAEKIRYSPKNYESRHYNGVRSAT